MCVSKIIIQAHLKVEMAMSAYYAETCNEEVKRCVALNAIPSLCFIEEGEIRDFNECDICDVIHLLLKSSYDLEDVIPRYILHPLLDTSQFAVAVECIFDMAVRTNNLSWADLLQRFLMYDLIFNYLFLPMLIEVLPCRDVHREHVSCVGHW